MSTESDILKALLDHLATLVLSPPLPVAQPNVAFSAAKSYLRADFLLNQTRQITIGDDPQQKRGLLQVTVVWAPGQGLVKPLKAAGDIINHFKNRVLWADETRITIDREPWAASPMQEPDRVEIPVSISWHAFEPEV